MPEFEAHKLDEMKEVLTHAQEPTAAGFSGFVQSKPWLAVVLAGVGGLCLGLWVKSRR